MPPEKLPKSLRTLDSSAKHHNFQFERDMLESILMEKLLRVKKEKTQIKVGSTVFRFKPPLAEELLEVVKIADGVADVIWKNELKKNKMVTILSFKIDELWDEKDCYEIFDLIAELSTEEIKAKIAGDYQESYDKLN